jgi:hypothetical protein
LGTFLNSLILYAGYDMPIGPLPQQVFHVNKSILANQTPTAEKSLIGCRKSTKKYSKFGESN